MSFLNKSLCDLYSLRSPFGLLTSRENAPLSCVKTLRSLRLKEPYSSFYQVRLIVSFLLIPALFLYSCTETKPNQSAPQDYQKVQINHSQGLRIWKNADTYKVEIRNPRDTAKLMATYYFDPQKSKSQGDTITIPIQKAALNSTTFIAFFDKLGFADKVKGVTFTDRVMNPHLKDQIAKSETVELISAGELDFEKVIALQPDVFMAYSYAESDFSRIEAQHIPVVLNMEYLELTPLGRAEWIKLVGILTGNYNRADSVFTEVERSYKQVQSKVAEINNKPSVFTGSRYQNSWYAPGRDSYIANYIRDAGGGYVFDNLEGAGSTEIDFEVALKAISDADYWGMVVSQDEPYTLETVREEDPRYADFNSFRADHIFVCNAAKTDYFGDAVMEPNEILKDMVAILHRDIIPNRDYRYFHPL